jgi:hypothetical protein
VEDEGEEGTYYEVVDGVYRHLQNAAVARDGYDTLVEAFEHPSEMESKRDVPLASVVHCLVPYNVDVCVGSEVVVGRGHDHVREG